MILEGTPGLLIWRLGDCVCDRLGGTTSCLIGSIARGGDRVAGPGAKEAVYGREDELACCRSGRGPSVLAAASSTDFLC